MYQELQRKFTTAQKLSTTLPRPRLVFRNTYRQQERNVQPYLIINSLFTNSYLFLMLTQSFDILIKLYVEYQLELNNVFFAKVFTIFGIFFIKHLQNFSCQNLVRTFIQVSVMFTNFFQREIIKIGDKMRGKNSDTLKFNYQFFHVFRTLRELKK